MFGFIWWIIVGLIAGWLTGKIMSGGGYGPLMDIIIGILGALEVVSLCRAWALRGLAASFIRSSSPSSGP